MSVEVFLRKCTGGGLVADDALSKERLDKFKAGTILRTDLTKPRNYMFHKKFFAMRNVAFENQEQYTDDEAFRKALIIEAGYYDEIRLLDGTVLKVARSINFGSMEEVEFGELYAKVFSVILWKVIPGADGVALQSAIDEVVSFA